MSAREQFNEDSRLVTRQKSATDLVIAALPCIKELPSDPEWEATEKRMVEHNNQKLPRFEE